MKVKTIVKPKMNILITLTIVTFHCITICAPKYTITSTTITIQ